MIGRRIGPYEIVAMIGAGGMGEVYRAHDAKLQRDVAIKLLPPAVAHDPQRLDRFEREARALAALNHANIAQVHGFEESDGTCAIVMELVDGETLAELIARGPLPANRALRLGRQIADALEAAHARGIIHRDLKPANIKVRADGTAKVLDFGLAKDVGNEQRAPELTHASTVRGATVAGVVMGTAPYMSPEQARGKPVDARTDVWAFGCVLFEMLSGRRTFGGETAADAMAAVLDREPDWAALPPDTPTAARQLLRRCLEKNADLRLRDIADAKAAIDDALAGPGAKPEGPPIKPERPRRQARLALIALAIVVAAAAVAFVARSWKTESAIDSVAVLPFVNQNRDPDAEYLSDGLAESIINNLSQIGSMRVIARASAFRYKGPDVDHLAAARQLGVRAVVVGRVSQRGGSLLVSAELVDVQGNTQLWGQQYTRQVSDLFALQEEIAREISEKLRIKLTGVERQQFAKRPTENIKAFQSYMQGRTLLQRRTREDMLEAIKYFEQAIAEDQAYALAYTGLAEAYVVLGARGYIAPRDGRTRGEDAARQALALDASLAEAHLAVSQPLVMFPPYDSVVADRELHRAVELSPSLAMAHNYLGLLNARLGRYDESVAFYRKSRELDPLSLINARASLLPLLFRGDYTRAWEGLRQTRDLGPSFIIPLEIGYYVENRKYAEAEAELTQAARLRSNDPIIIYSAGVVSAVQGRRPGALEAIRQLEALSGPELRQAHWIAKVYAALQEKDQALSWLERGFAVRAIADFFGADPIWAPLRAEPRFTALRREMHDPDQ